MSEMDEQEKKRILDIRIEKLEEPKRALDEEIKVDVTKEDVEKEDLNSTETDVCVVEDATTEAMSEIKKEQPEDRNMEKKNKKKTKASIVFSILAKTGIFLLTTILLIVIGLYGVMWILIKGPSETAKNEFVCALQETSAIGFLAELYLSEEEVEAIVQRNLMVEVDDGTVSDPGKIDIPDPTIDTDIPDLEIIDIKGTTYRGKLMIIKDPSRLFVGTVEEFKDAQGQVVKDIMKRYDVVAGINGGEFYDMGDVVYSARPVGGVISEGKHVFGNLNTIYNLTGFTNENVLVIGKMTVKQALDMGVRDAVHTNHTTGPFLIIDGEPLTVPDTNVYGGGKNPRTAIGQRDDGAVLLLVIDGRQANSIGATFEELVYIMLEHGAINAAAMDGGTSTQMVYEGEVINNPYSPTGPRKCPTSFLVRSEEE